MRASSSSRMPSMSGVFAPVIVMAIGTPPPSVRMWRLVPDFARSVGLGPVFSPSQRGLVERRVGRLPRPLRRTGRKRARHGLPLTSRAEHVEDRVEDAARGNPGTPARALQLLAGQDMLHDQPQVVRNSQIVGRCRAAPLAAIPTPPLLRR